MTYLTASKIDQIAASNLIPTPVKGAADKILTEVAAAIVADVAAPASVFVDRGLKAMGTLRVASAVKDAETVTIGADVYEVDTRDTEHITDGRIRLDLHGGSTVKAQGTLTIANVAVAGDTMTIGTKVYTFVPAGTANADGEIAVGVDQLTQEAAIVAAINGTDGWNDPHPLVSIAAFVGHVGTITALSGGTGGNAIVTTETLTAVGNVFDAATLGTATAGVDPTAEEFVDALVAAVNASGTEAVSAAKISANEVLIFRDAVGVNTTAISETLAGANNAVDTAALRAGAAVAQRKFVAVARVPNAQEVAIGNLHIPLDFVPTAAIVQVKQTADGVVKAWNGGVILTGGANPYVTVNNAGNTDWATTDTVTVLIFG